MSGTARNAAAAAEAAAVYLALEDRVVPGEADLAHLTSSLQEARVWMARESAVPGFAAALEEARRLREQATAGAGDDHGDNDDDEDEDEDGRCPAAVAAGADEPAASHPPPTSAPATAAPAVRLPVPHRHAHPTSLRIPTTTNPTVATTTHLLPATALPCTTTGQSLPPALVLRPNPNPDPNHHAATITLSLTAHDQSFGPRGQAEARASFELVDYEAGLPLFLFVGVGLRGRDGGVVRAAEGERLMAVFGFEGQ